MCNISSITTSNLSVCNDNGTPSYASDDFFTADVTVNYTLAPTTGNLDLTGDGTATVAVSSIGAASHTFTGVMMSADGGAIDLIATFSADASCTLNNTNAGTAPFPCSANVCLPTQTINTITTSNLSACNDNGTPTDASDDFFTADITVNYSGTPSTGNLDLTGDGTATAAVGSIGATSHTFTGVTMSADGGAIDLTATFSASPACTLNNTNAGTCLLYTSPSPRDQRGSRMPSSA